MNKQKDNCPTGGLEALLEESKAPNSPKGMKMQQQKLGGHPKIKAAAGTYGEQGKGATVSGSRTMWGHAAWGALRGAWLGPALPPSLVPLQR